MKEPCSPAPGHGVACPGLPTSALSSARVGLLAALLGAEVLLLTLRFDAGQVAGETGWWAWVLVHSSRFLRALIAMAAATLLFGGKRIWCDCRELLEKRALPSRWWVYLAVHLLFLVGFAWITRRALEGDLGASSCPGVWTISWLALGGATGGFWLAAVFPPSLWWAVVRRAAVPLGAGVAAGVTAFALGEASAEMWLPLSRATLGVVRFLLGLFTPDVVCQPDDLVIGTASFTVGIAPDCSGYQGVGLILVFLIGYVVLFRDQLRFPHVLVLFPLGVLLIWLANAARIAALIGIGSAGWAGVALGGFHSQAGWLAFNALALGLVVASRNVPLFQAEISPHAGTRAGFLAGATAAYLVPFLCILGVSLLTGALSAGFDWLYPLRVVAALAALWYFRESYGRWDGSLSYQAVGLGALAFGLWLLLAPASGATGLPPELSRVSPAVSTVWWCVRVFGYVATVPLAEELAFRGYLTRRLMRRSFEEVPLGSLTWLSFLASSLLFGLLHGGNWMAGSVAGMLFAVALRQRGRLADAVTAHAVTNALLVVYALLTGRWGLCG